MPKKSSETGLPKKNVQSDSLETAPACCSKFFFYGSQGEKNSPPGYIAMESWPKHGPIACQPCRTMPVDTMAWRARAGLASSKKRDLAAIAISLRCHGHGQATRGVTFHHLCRASLPVVHALVTPPLPTPGRGRPHRYLWCGRCHPFGCARGAEGRARGRSTYGQQTE